MSKQSLILAIPDYHLHDDYTETGFHVRTEREILEDFRIQKCWLGRRCELEHMPTFKQIIPYVYTRQNDQILSYVRSRAAGEDRLHDRYSIGFGGHIEIQDCFVRIQSLSLGELDPLDMIVDVSVGRELTEELHLTDDRQLIYRGVVYDDMDDVGRVHIGIVIEALLPSDWSITECQTNHEIDGLAWVDIPSLVRNIEHYEGWSRHLISHLASGSL